MNPDKKHKKIYLVMNTSLAVSILCTVVLCITIYNPNIAGAVKIYSAVISGVLSVLSAGCILPISIAHLKTRLEEYEKRVKVLTVTDEMTALYSRKFFILKLNSEFERSRRYKYPLSLIIANIDSFKTINEKYGLNEGDLVLKSVADIIRPLCRESDTVARFGESEFAIILPNTGDKGAIVIAEKLRSNVESYKYNKGIHPVTISLGISTMSPDSVYSAETLIYDADTALYRSQESGKNRAVFYNPL